MGKKCLATWTIIGITVDKDTGFYNVKVKSDNGSTLTTSLSRGRFLMLQKFFGALLPEDLIGEKFVDVGREDKDAVSAFIQHHSAQF